MVSSKGVPDCEQKWVRHRGKELMQESATAKLDSEDAQCEQQQRREKNRADNISRGQNRTSGWSGRISGSPAWRRKIGKGHR